MTATGTIYLLHFDQPYKHAKHYMGWASDLDARVAEHGHAHGARLDQRHRRARHHLAPGPHLARNPTPRTATQAPRRQVPDVPAVRNHPPPPPHPEHAVSAAAGSDWSRPGTEASTFMIGVDAAGRHVIPAADALLAIATSEQHPITGAACGARVIVARKWGEYHRNHPVLKSDDRLCPTCAGSAALATGRLEQELDALRPRDITLQVMGRLLPDPQVLPRLCRSIIDQLGADEQDHSRLIEVLAHATAHRPVVLLPEECGDGECDPPAVHRNRRRPRLPGVQPARRRLGRRVGGPIPA